MATLGNQLPQWASASRWISQRPKYKRLFFKTSQLKTWERLSQRISQKNEVSYSMNQVSAKIKEFWAEIN